MNVVVIPGDPETLQAAIQAIIDLGNDIVVLTKCKNDSKYIVVYV